VTYKVQLSPHAVRQYKKLGPSVKSAIQGGLDALQDHPLAGSRIKRLKGRLHEYYRYRVGDYRIVYVVAQHEHVVCVDYLQHRKDVYRDIH
jgi:mRNA interferase RelE/StbE